MKPTIESMGESGIPFDAFNACEHEEDFQEFYKIYKELTDNAICEKEGVQFGDRKPVGKILDVTHSNLSFLLGRGNKMRTDFARKVWWFL